MKIGILNACTPQDEARIAVREVEIFEDLFAFALDQFTFVEYRVTEGELPQKTADCDAYLITGSPKGAYDSDVWIAELAAFIRQAFAEQTRLVGICFGHQILAHSLGGRAEKSAKGWGIGLKTVEIVEKRPFMAPTIEDGQFYFCHQDQVTQLPPGAVRLAGSAFCPNGMFVIDDKVLGIQAHPEFTPPIMKRVINWHQKMGTNKRVTAVSNKMNGTPDNTVLAQWIARFFQT